VNSQVEELFSEFGSVVSVRIGAFLHFPFIQATYFCYREGMSPSGESKGFAHVDFGDQATAEAVMKAHAESQFFLDGRQLVLDYATPVGSSMPSIPVRTLHFANFSGDEALLKETLDEYTDVIEEIKLSAYFFFQSVSCLQSLTHFFQCETRKRTNPVVMVS